MWHIEGVPVSSLPSSTVVVRTVHVLAVALLVGGGATTWWLVRQRSLGVGPGGSPLALRVARTYEWLFWGAVGLVVLTGVGNLGAMAPGVPDPSTAWGRTLAVKVAAVVVLLVGSVPRTAAVVRLSDRERRGRGSSLAKRLSVAYGSTTLYLVGLLGLGVVLAHG